MSAVETPSLSKSILAGFLRMFIGQCIASYGTFRILAAMQEAHPQEMEVALLAFSTFLASCLIYMWSAVVKYLRQKQWVELTE